MCEWMIDWSDFKIQYMFLNVRVKINKFNISKNNYNICWNMKIYTHLRWTGFKPILY